MMHNILATLENLRSLAVARRPGCFGAVKQKNKMKGVTKNSRNS